MLITLLCQFSEFKCQHLVSFTRQTWHFMAISDEMVFTLTVTQGIIIFAKVCSTIGKQYFCHFHDCTHAYTQLQDG